MKQKNKKRSAKKSLVTVSKSRHLNLINHKHTGRLLHPRSTAYPVLAMIVLCVGVLLSGMGRMAQAATFTESGSYSVTASLPAPPPSRAASIDFPLNGARILESPVVVSGTCPLNTYVKIIRNRVDSGIALCDGKGNYSLKIDLFNGANALQAQVYNKTDAPGPNSNTTTVYYEPAVSTQGSNYSANISSGSNGPLNPAMPLILSTKFRYLGHYSGQSTAYKFAIEGGKAPYAINVNWGDGSQKTISLPASGAFTLTHTYNKAEAAGGGYIITISAGDAQGSQTILQLVAIINDRPTVPVATSTTTGSNMGGDLSQRIHGLLKYIWPTYGITVLMLASFWLGELREIKLLHPKHRRIHHV